MVVCREGTEGPYMSVRAVPAGRHPQEIMMEESLNTGSGSSESCGTRSLARARRRPGKVTLVHKTNVLTNAGSLWQRTFNEVA